MGEGEARALWSHQLLLATVLRLKPSWHLLNGDTGPGSPREHLHSGHRPRLQLSKRVSALRKGRRACQTGRP